MIRKLALISAILALPACDFVPIAASAAPAPLGTGPRAPDHPSQSHPMATLAEEQIQIGQVEQNLAQLLDQYGAQHASGRTRAPGTSDVITALQPGADHQFRVTLIGGAAYSFVGACDVDCNDIDVELLRASDGRVVGSDLLFNDEPVVDFSPRANGDYYVRIILKTCTRAPCYVAARILQARAARARQ